MSVKNRLFSVAKVLLLITAVVGLLTVKPEPVDAAAPDPVLQWIGIVNDTAIAGLTNPLATTRVTALVAASMFDAVNGIRPRYRSLYVRPHVSGSASQRAAAVEAAYVVLSTLYPAQAGSLGTSHDASIAAISATERAQSVQAGRAWGQTVASTILQLRSNDGLAPPPPPFVGVLGMDPKTRRRVAPYSTSVCNRRSAAMGDHDTLGTDAPLSISPAPAQRPNQR